MKSERAKRFRKSMGSSDPESLEFLPSTYIMRRLLGVKIARPIYLESDFVSRDGIQRILGR
jgi:hypothetical protein